MYTNVHFCWHCFFFISQLLRKEKLKELRKAKRAPKFTKNSNPGFNRDIFSETDYYFENGNPKYINFIESYGRFFCSVNVCVCVKAKLQKAKLWHAWQASASSCLGSNSAFWPAQEDKLCQSLPPLSQWFRFFSFILCSIWTTQNGPFLSNTFLHSA